MVLRANNKQTMVIHVMADECLGKLHRKNAGGTCASAPLDGDQSRQQLREHVTSEGVANLWEMNVETQCLSSAEAVL